MANKSKSGTFSDFEREAMKARAKELAAEAKATNKRAQGEKDVQAAIAAMSEPDLSMAKKIHEIVTANFPVLSPKTWYGMPAYAKDDKVLCFFQPAEKFEARYATFGFNDIARLDEGNMWPVGFGLKKLTSTEESRIIELVRKAVG